MKSGLICEVFAAIKCKICRVPSPCLSMKIKIYKSIILPVFHVAVKLRISLWTPLHKVCLLQLSELIRNLKFLTATKMSVLIFWSVVP